MTQQTHSLTFHPQHRLAALLHQPKDIPMKHLLLATLAAFALSGCAMSRSHMETAHTNLDGTGHGDILTKSAFSTLGKQQVEQRTDFHVMPNNSGVDLVDGAISNQDTTGALDLIKVLVPALVQAFTAAQAAQPAPVAMSRLDSLAAQVESIRTIVDALKPTPR